MAEGCDDNRRRPAASSYSVSSPGSITTQLQLSAQDRLEQDEDRGDGQLGMQIDADVSPSHFYEELFCSSRACVSLAPLAGALLSTAGPQSDAVKQGYLGKLERNHKRYFVLRAGSHTGPSRLEWYKNREKFMALEKSAGKAALFGLSRQGVIYLRCCLGVSRTGSSRRGHTVALYAKDQTMVLVVEDQQEQEEWYLAIKGLMEDEEPGEGFDEEDDGYCTLPSAAFFKEVWPVTVKPRGLGRSRSLTGETRLCLTATSLILVRVGACSHLASVTIPLLSVRRFGHSDGSFFVELGRSAPDGPGEIWMEARDQRNPGAAQHIHEVVRKTIRALRALPDFSNSPTSNHTQPQALLVSKRSRPKYRDKQGNVQGPNSLLVQSPRNSDIKSNGLQSDTEPRKPKEIQPVISLSSPLRSQQTNTSSESGSYMEMKTDSCSVAACRVEGWEQEEQKEGMGYMMMSPQVSVRSSVLPQGDYVVMASPEKQHWPPSSSPSSGLQSSSNRSSSDTYSTVHQLHHQTNECGQRHWQLMDVHPSEVGAGQSQGNAGQEPESAQQRQHLMRSRASSFPAGSINASDPWPPLITRRQTYTTSFQASPNSGAGLASRHHALPDRSAGRRSWLSSCLLSCLQNDERS